MTVRTDNEEGSEAGGYRGVFPTEAFRSTFGDLGPDAAKNALN